MTDTEHTTEVEVEVCHYHPYGCNLDISMKMISENPGRTIIKPSRLNPEGTVVDHKTCERRPMTQQEREALAERDARVP